MSTASYETRVYYEDTDAGGVAYYANYLKWAERGRTEWLRQRGYTHNALRASNVVAVVSEATLKIIKPAKLDDMLAVRTSVEEMRGARISFKQRVMRMPEETLLAEIGVKAATVAADSFKPVRVDRSLPNVFRD